MPLFMKAPPQAWATLSLALAAVLALSACDRRKEGNAGDMSPATGATNPTPSETPPAGSTGAGSASTVTSPMTATMPPSASTTAGTGAALNSADQAFLAEVTRANEEEIAVTALGMERGNRKDKALAKSLHDAHVGLRGQVAALMPNAPTPAPGTVPASLADLNGAAFDKQLLDVLHEGHESAIRKFTDAMNNPALSESVRTFAKATLPTLQAHLQSVQDLRSR
jgi:putative membrane protein